MRSIKFVLGTFFGSGLLPGAPGTWGSLAALPFIYLTGLYFGLPGLIGFVLLTSVLSLWSASESEQRFGKDPGQFVMDEVAGQAVVFLFVAFQGDLFADAAILFGGFLLFRLFDILKPLGINRLQKLPGKYGILVDDLVAGIYALIVLEASIYVAASLF